MALALMLGRRGMGRVWPNPAVGCVIVADGHIVGRAHTADGGRPHAETQALAQAGDKARGATAYVTLEPCSHHGQTPPCAAALITAGIARVVVATTDPNPKVSGQGIAMLRDAGVTVDLGIGQAQADRDHAGFFLTQTAKRPFVTLKLATTLDGRIATRTGDSQWITGPQARHVVHAMRARHDAVMVGAGTVRADNPSLNVRGFGDVPQPVRVVVGTGQNLPATGHLAATARSQPVWLCHDSNHPMQDWQAVGAQSVPCGLQNEQIDLNDALAALAGHGLTRIFCEGGGALAASLLRAGLVDELVLFQGGRIIGAEGRAATGPLLIDRLASAPAFDLVDQRQMGGDVMQVWRPA